jgi:phosphoglycerate dehydrogenase-like enzyme
MRRVNVLYLPQNILDSYWKESIVSAVGARHDLRVYDETKPLAPQFKGAEVVLDTGGSVGTHAMMDAATDTKLWQVLGTGLDHVDVEYMKAKGFIVCNCPGQFSSIALAECAMTYILMLSRRFKEALANFESSAMYRPIAGELGGKVLGIFGFGASGEALARRAKPFGMRIYGFDVREIEGNVLNEIKPDFMGGPEDLDGKLPEMDFLSLHLHLTAETRHIIDARRLGLMKKTACIINVARGALVDEDAMHKALLDGALGGAGLDVFAAEPADPNLPVYKLPNVVATPHVAGTTYETARKRAGVAAENVDRISKGLEPLYRVDT